MSERKEDLDPDFLAESRKRWERHGGSLIEFEPVHREGQPCWCTDIHIERNLFLSYCPLHGREPDADLWDSAAGPFLRATS